MLEQQHTPHYKNGKVTIKETTAATKVMQQMTKHLHKTK